MQFIGIAGGSGSGKSSVSYALVDDEPNKFEVINLDDYQKLRTDPNLPKLAGMINWDHPDIIRWDDLISDIHKLKKGQSVTVDVWAHRSNPDYFKHYKLKPRTIKPKPVVIIEGYLTLFNPAVRKLLGRAYYFDLDEKTRNWRRDKGAVLKQDAYLTRVLEPMHSMFVEPTKAYADKVIDVSSKSVQEIAAILRADINKS